MKLFNVRLFGLFGNTVFNQVIEAKNKVHAIHIASAIYSNCWKEAKSEEIND